MRPIKTDLARQTLVERNQWLRNVGLLWILLGAVFTGISLTGDEGLKISVWLWVGLAAAAAQVGWNWLLVWGTVMALAKESRESYPLR